MTELTQATWTPLPALLDDLADSGFAEFHPRLNEAGHPAIRQGHGCVFRFIDEDGSRLTELAERSALTKQAVGEVVADLENLGYVERAPDPGDGRAKLIKLTERGALARQTARRGDAGAARGDERRPREPPRNPVQASEYSPNSSRMTPQTSPIEARSLSAARIGSSRFASPLQA